MGFIESYKNYQPRLLVFYGAVVLMLLVLAVGLAYRQLIRTDLYSEREKLQSQRRVIVPGPRGNIYDREGRALVENRPRFAVALYLAELRREFRAKHIEIVRNFRELEKEIRPKDFELQQLARQQVVQCYLDEVNRILGRQEKANGATLERHFRAQLLLPYLLIDDLGAEEYARLIERLPVKSPLQVYASSTRHYPHGPAAAHVLGYVAADPEPETQNLPGSELTTFAMKGTVGRDGLERKFDPRLQGESGGTIYQVDPAGYKIEPPITKHFPVQGADVVTSIDLDLQLAAEKQMEGKRGAAVAVDVRTGEILVAASRPAYDLNDFAPAPSSAVIKQIEEQGAWLNRAVSGLYPPGSTFKLVTSLAGLRAQAIRADSRVNCTGYHQVGGKLFVCHGGHGHGEINFVNSIAQSCNVFFYKYGIDTGVGNLAEEARRFGLDKPTGVELPSETRAMRVPDPEWKKKREGMPWFPGDTANLSIGQGDLQVTPLQMALFAASLARWETDTRPTLLRVDPSARREGASSSPVGLPEAHRQAIVDGLERCVQLGTGKFAQVPGVRVGGKTGTAQKRTKEGTLEIAWFIGFAPLDNPQIAFAVVMEGTEPDENYAGGRMAAPVAQAFLQAYFDKQAAPARQRVAGR